MGEEVKLPSEQVKFSSDQVKCPGEQVGKVKFGLLAYQSNARWYIGVMFCPSSARGSPAVSQKPLDKCFNNCARSIPGKVFFACLIESFLDFCVIFFTFSPCFLQVSKLVSPKRRDYSFFKFGMSA